MFKFFDVIDRGALWLSVCALLFIMSVTCISVIGRYFFNAPIPDDLVMSEFTMVVVAFLPMAAVQASREHVFVTIFSDWLPNRPKVAMELFGVYLGVVIFTIVNSLQLFRAKDLNTTSRTTSNTSVLTFT